MMEFFRRRGAAVALALLALLSGAAAVAARVDDLYAATVSTADASPQATQAAFAEALRLVLVKVTGRAAAGEDARLLQSLGDPASLVQQFRRDGAGNLWARFDAAELRRRLAAAGIPNWGEERPLTVVWLAYDTGTGERDVLASAGAEGAVSEALRRDLLAAADARGVPVLLPLRDSQEIAAVSYADLWGEFSDRVVSASERYRSDAILVGRARLFPAPLTDVQWTLLLGEERMEWRGTVADGPRGLAERLGQRLAATAAPVPAGPVRLAVSGIGSLAQYGEVLGYLRGLDVIEDCSVAYVDGDTMVFDLQLRADRAQLQRALAARRIMEPVPDPAPGVTAPVEPGLVYRLAPRL
jgi:hypothetical protein